MSEKLTLTALGKLVALHGVLTHHGWWRGHMREAEALRPHRTHKAMLLERSTGWSELLGDGFCHIARPGHGKKRFTEATFLDFAKKHGTYTEPIYWEKGIREFERMVDQGTDIDVGIGERRDGLKGLANRWDELFPQPVVTEKFISAEDSGYPNGIIEKTITDADGTLILTEPALRKKTR